MDLTDDIKGKMITLIMALLHSLVVVLVGFLAISFAETSLVVGLIIGLVVWAILIGKTPLLDWTFFNTSPNWSLIVGNQVVADSIPKEGAKDSEGRELRATMFPLASMREVGPGIRGKIPTEVVYDSVDLQTELVLESELPCYTKNDVALLVKWQGILTPLRGSLVNLVRNGEKASEAYFRGVFEKSIIGWVRIHEDKDVYGKLDTINEWFKKVFGGPFVIDPIEKNYGLFTNDPQVTSIKRTKEFERAAEARAISDNMAKAMETIKAQAEPGMDPNLLPIIAATMAGQPVDGVVLIPGIGNVDLKGGGAFMAAVSKLREQFKGKK